jgi:hypothetical protein
MDDLIKIFTVFQKTHSWWSSEAFMNSGNKVLKIEIRRAIEKSLFATTLAREGTQEQFQDFVDSIFEHCPRMMFVFFPIFLDYMKTQENLQEPVSIGILNWYRNKGWSFPRFDAETKIEVVAVKTSPGTQE